MIRYRDAALALLCMILLALPMAVIAAVVRVFDGPSVLFRQLRVGQDFRPFIFYKFRTMRPSAGGGQRVTWIGRWLRRTRLDELPQLFNVVSGDMVIVGPRPEIPRFADSGNDSFLRVTRVPPGLFDNATLDWLDEESLLEHVEDPAAYYREVIQPEKLARSLTDIEQKSFRGDCRIILRALRTVPRRVAPPPRQTEIARRNAG